MLPRKIRRTPTYSTAAQQNCSIIKKRKRSGPAVLSVVVLYRTWKSQAGRPSFHWTTHDQPVAFDAVCALPPVQLAVGVHIDAAVGPDTSPRRVVDEHHVCAPVKAAQTPSPRTKCRG